VSCITPQTLYSDLGDFSITENNQGKYQNQKRFNANHKNGTFSQKRPAYQSRRDHEFRWIILVELRQELD
jgi:hypothetical protein